MSEESTGADESGDPYDLDAGPDPADVAAAAPEPSLADAGADAPAAAEPPVYAVGVGPGNPAYLTPRGERAIAEADVVVGFETVVDVVRDTTEADLLTCGYRDEAATLERFAARVADGERGTAVLMGDPNHSGYQFVGKVQSAVERALNGEADAAPGDHGHDSGGSATPPVRVIPGISSLQVAASRARTPMEDSCFVTLHKSGDVEPDLRRLRDAVGDRHLLVLPRPFDLMPEDVAADLLEAGGPPDATALVLERLTHEDEAITRATLSELAALAEGGTEAAADESPFSDLSVLVVRAD